MKFNWKSIFGYKISSTNNSSVDKKHINYDQNADFYYTNIINSIILYTYDSVKLDKMTPILIDPLTELYEEIEYAFTPICFDTVFRVGLIDNSLKEELLLFKNNVDKIPTDIWKSNFIDNHEKWLEIRQQANNLLIKLGVTSRRYNEKYSITYDKEGNMIRNGKKL